MAIKAVLRIELDGKDAWRLARLRALLGYPTVEATLEAVLEAAEKRTVVPKLLTPEDGIEF